MISSDSCLCETSFDAVDAVKLEIPEGFKFFDQKTIQYPENKITIDNLVKSRFWDGKEKSSRSRRANSEECSVTQILDFLRSHQQLNLQKIETLNLGIK